MQLIGFEPWENIMCHSVPCRLNVEWLVAGEGFDSIV